MAFIWAKTEKNMHIILINVNHNFGSKFVKSYDRTYYMRSVFFFAPKGWGLILN